jgi:prepilin peptidase CpaA
VQTLILACAMAVFAVAAWGDVRTRRIPNTVALALGALGLARMIALGEPVAAGYTIAASAAVFVVAFLLFCIGVIGGGDAKFVSAAALVVGAHGLVAFLILMSLCGSLLAIALLLEDKLIPRLRRNGRRERPAATESGVVPVPRSVPYGVAIATAGAMILILQSSVSG